MAPTSFASGANGECLRRDVSEKENSRDEARTIEQITQRADGRFELSAEQRRVRVRDANRAGQTKSENMSNTTQSQTRDEKRKCAKQQTRPIN